jgi:CheY-like chemotaxis protein
MEKGKFENKNKLAMNESKKINDNLLPLNILYVEDDGDDQDFFQEGLNKVSPDTICHLAKDADEARELLNKVHIIPDYIFLDINMPGTDGITFLKEIKESENLKLIPIIIYTTTSTQTDALRCRRLGALDVITKPTTFQGVCNVIKKYCDRTFSIN